MNDAVEFTPEELAVLDERNETRSQKVRSGFKRRQLVYGPLLIYYRVDEG